VNDLKVIDEHLGSLKIHFGFPRRGMGDKPEAERCLLGIHHHEFDEALGEVGGVGGLLDFGHNDEGV
jgi:hypothetical protein